MVSFVCKNLCKGEKSVEKFKKALRIAFPSETLAVLKTSFAATFILGFIAHGYAFLNAFFSHDNLVIFADRSEETWKLTLGRILVPIYRSLRGGYNSPLLIGVLSLFWISLSVYFCCRFFDVKSRAVAVAFSAVFTVNLTVIAQTATYLYELDFDMLALLCAVLAAFLWKKGGKAMLAVPLFVFVSLGIYQSYVEVTVALMIMHSIVALVKEYSADVKRIFKKGLCGIGVLLAGAVLYAICVVVLVLCFDVSVESGQANSLSNLLTEKQYLALIPKAVAVCVYRWLNMGGFRVGVELFGHSSHGIITAFCAALTALIPALPICFAFKKKIKPLNLVLAGALCVLLPLGMDFVYVLSNGAIHHLMMYAIWLAWLIPLLFTQTQSFGQSFKAGTRSAIKAAVFVCLAVILAANIKTSNAVYLKKDLEASTTLSVITDVSRLIHDVDGYEAGTTKVAFAGRYRNGAKIPGFEDYYALTGNTHNLAITDELNAPNYYKYLLNEEINTTVCNGDIYDSEEFLAMPSYPDRGCVGFIGDVLVVKLGDKPQ